MGAQERPLRIAQGREVPALQSICCKVHVLVQGVTSTSDGAESRIIEFFLKFGWALVSFLSFLSVIAASSCAIVLQCATAGFAFGGLGFVLFAIVLLPTR